jgi:hypothetical protein
MQSQYDQVVWWDFGGLGWPGWTSVTVLEMCILFDGAERIRERNSPEACLLWLQDRKAVLLNQAINHGINKEWISQALLITAVSGLMGFDIPDVLFLNG